DYVEGGAGSDEIYGMHGDDVLLGEGGRDALYGGYGNDVLLGGKGDDYLHGGKDDDCVIADEGADVMWGGLDSDDFVFGHCVIDTEGHKTDEIGFDKGNVVKDFSVVGNDMLVFHTAYEDPGELKAELVDNDGDGTANDIKITATDFQTHEGGSVIVEDLWSTLGLDSVGYGLRPGDAGFEDNLMEYLLNYNDELEIGKGVIRFEDKCVELKEIDVPPVDIDCEI
ncbi:hypothetical protein DRV85_18400, partial [Rhodosalinus halophilus]